ncbi:MAG: bifunctional [glutamate--ammonia ligase]-adenylyl-L-tyrosine phosphorylase/[glutamate--ammonia-ligase] adenylyltransferase [Nitrospinae bacterium]|nr:bifunctional [glutamate--ammonia ligase]-adenylyl-L-tyrosine phosphorylase/[glutamate--ammonia-ligase] adenylyltransferase [Nitrospinota bacterium]
MKPEEYAQNTADPEAALAGLNCLAQSLPGIGVRPEMAPLASLFAGSQAISEWLLARPEDAEWLAADEKLFSSRSKESMEEEMASLLSSGASPMAALRIFKRRELSRIAARELSGLAGLEETLTEWSNVADVAIDSAARIAMAAAVEKHGRPVYTPFEETEEKNAGFAVLAMGKLGGGELNISSDIDIVFVHSSDNGSTTGREDGAGKITLHQFFVGTARQTARLLSEPTEDGYVFRVDMDLRPEGKKGEISNSIGAMEIYYESWGQQWERQALIKARFCGGSAEVGEETLARLKPFMYRKYLDQRAIDEIAAMKGKIDQSQAVKKGVKGAERNIKLGQGGIREIEFAAQSIQLLYGARYPELQTRSTIKALDISHALGLLSAPHHRDLREAYIFMRKLENRIQYHQLLQTHSLPENEKRLAALGRLMGFASNNPAAELLDETQKRRKRVHEVFALFFEGGGRKETDSFPAPLDDEAATAQWLDSIKFDQPEQSARSLNILRNGKPFTHPSERSRMTFDSFGPAIVNEALATPWPDHVIFGFERFVESKGAARDMLYSLLDDNRGIIKLLAAVFSSSEHLTSVLIRQPDLLDRMIAADTMDLPADRFRYQAEFSDAAQRGCDADEKMARMNMFRSAESLRLGLRRLLGLSDRFEVMDGLSTLAEEFLKGALSIAMESKSQSGLRWVIIAAGKLGRREMNYGSDIDLLAFCDGDEGDKERFTASVRKLIKLASAPTPYGAGYTIDMRLRPYGEKGEIAPLLSTMRDYYGGKADAWERIALVGAAPVAGEPGFTADAMEIIRGFITQPPLSRAEVEKFAAIRERIADEKVKHGNVDIKFGRGGLVEIEFICQWLRIENPPAKGQGWGDGPFTISTLALARKGKWLEPKSAAALEKAYNVFRAVEDAMRMDRERAVSAVPSNPAQLKRVARMANLPGTGPERFVEFVKETMAAVRKIYMEFAASRM